MTKPYRRYLWRMMFAMCIVSIDANLKPYLIKRLIDAAASTIPTNFLDEATSQLDSVTENVIQDSLWKLIQDKTTIVIA